MTNLNLRVLRVSVVNTPFRNSFCRCGVALCLGLCCSACSRLAPSTPQRLTTFSGPTMGTRYTVKLVDLPTGVDPETIRQEIERKLDHIDALMSTYDPDSELSRLNRFADTEWFSVSHEMARVIGEAVRIGQLTGGAFDITIGPLVNLWHFGPDKDLPDRIPSPEEITRAKSNVGFHNIEVRLSPPAVRKKRPGLCIDLSGIAKGFAVDQIAEHLECRGIENYFVDVGGDLRVKGCNQRGKPWNVAIEAPLADARAIQRTVPLVHGAMATSGDYRNYFEQNDIRYSHIIDPRSGKPISHKLASVTVLDSRCMRADALATALMVLGPKAGYELALQQSLPALFLVKSGAGFVEKVSPGLKSVLARPDSRFGQVVGMTILHASKR